MIIFMAAKKKTQDEKPARPRVNRDLWCRITAAASISRETPEAWMSSLIERYMPPAFRKGKL
jgi:hypothetical protein